MTDHDAELDAILRAVEAAGLVETYVGDDGRPIMRLTPDGERVARQLAMTDEDAQDALMAALLEDVQAVRPQGGAADAAREDAATDTPAPVPDAVPGRTPEASPS